MMKRYEESLADLNKLLEIDTNDMWALKAHEEVIREYIYDKSIFKYIFHKDSLLL